MQIVDLMQVATRQQNGRTFIEEEPPHLLDNSRDSNFENDLQAGLKALIVITIHTLGGNYKSIHGITVT